jgi:carboxyl-terminal processing protease
MRLAPRFLLAIILASTALVPAADAAYWVDRLPTSDRPVSRGTFVRAAVDQLSIPTIATLKLPYRRMIPTTLRPFVNAAYKRGALVPFGEEFAPAKDMTVGEALQVLVVLQNLTGPKASVSYSDVPKGSALESAVRVAVDKGWMTPAGDRVFGVDQPLSAAAARLLLRKVGGEDQPGTRQVIRFQVQQRTPLPKADILEAIWQLLEEQYLYNEKIDQDELAFTAAEAMVKTLNDPYTTYLRPIKAQDYQARIEGKVTGIGAQVEYRNDALLIVAPLVGSPAAAANLLAGDEILAADGVSLAGMDMLKAVSYVRGAEGTKVKLRIRRDGTTFEVTVTRATIDVPEIDIEWQGSVAIVRLYQFGDRTDRELRSLMQGVSDRHPSGIVLDLRNNPGGLLHAAGSVVGNFLPQHSTVARIITRDDAYAEQTEDPPVIDQTVPLAVLVNKGSASASEIVAGALQDYKRATIVGEQTFGKGTVQQVVDFKDQSSLKMTIAEWFTPLKRKIDGVGVTPDVVVVSNTGPEERDDQLLKGLEILRR